MPAQNKIVLENNLICIWFLQIIFDDGAFLVTYKPDACADDDGAADQGPLVGDVTEYQVAKQYSP